MKITDALRNTDWTLLRKQKAFLLTFDDDLSSGLLHLVDAIQDAAVADGIATEVEVFGPQEESE